MSSERASLAAEEAAAEEDEIHLVVDWFQGGLIGLLRRMGERERGKTDAQVLSPPLDSGDIYWIWLLFVFCFTLVMTPEGQFLYPHLYNRFPPVMLLLV